MAEEQCPAGLVGAACAENGGGWGGVVPRVRARALKLSVAAEEKGTTSMGQAAMADSSFKKRLAP